MRVQRRFVSWWFFVVVVEFCQCFWSKTLDPTAAPQRNQKSCTEHNRIILFENLVYQWAQETEKLFQNFRFLLLHLLLSIEFDANIGMHKRSSSEPTKNIAPNKKHTNCNENCWWKTKRKLCVNERTEKYMSEGESLVLVVDRTKQKYFSLFHRSISAIFWWSIKKFTIPRLLLHLHCTQKNTIHQLYKSKNSEIRCWHSWVSIWFDDEHWNLSSVLFTYLRAPFKFGRRFL